MIEIIISENDDNDGRPLRTGRNIFIYLKINEM